jgi:hypothetical protein
VAVLHEEVIEKKPLDFELDGRLILKDRALKNGDFELYN